MERPRRLEEYPPEIHGFLRELFRQASVQFRAVLESHGIQPGLSHALAQKRIRVLDEAMQPVVESMAKAGTPVACARGCGCCCSLTIQATPDEVFALKDELERSLSPAALAELKARAAAADARGHGLAPLARHRLRLFCPVLDPATQECLGHAARPSGCQGYLSLNLAQCAADHANPSQPVAQPVAAGMLRDAVGAACEVVLEDAGAPRQSLELTAGLVAAWAEPDAEARWLRGETVLVAATSTDNPPESST